MEIENKIKEKISLFFNWINQPIIQNFYIKDLKNWDAICASLHILNDLQRPKEEYYALKSINHLEVIGIMQTIYIEQDSIQTLKNALLEENYSGFKLSKYNKVRDLRNKIFAHPSDKKSGRVTTRHFFDISDKKQQTIKHLYWGTVEEIESEEFRLPDMILENSKTTYTYLESLEVDVIVKFKKIMEKYKVSFDKVFNGANYIFEKLLTKENDNVVINMYEETIENEINRIEIGFRERNIYEEFERELDVLKFLSSKLKSLFHEQTYKNIEFYTYASIMSEKVRSLSRKLNALDKDTLPVFK